jgi:hypothetical protein
VIVDTGSSDGTQEVIRNFLRDIPGTLHERPWVDFSHKPQRGAGAGPPDAGLPAVHRRRRDAGHAGGFRWPALDGDGYRFNCEYAQLRYHRNALIATRLPWRWLGVLHEYLDCAAAARLAASCRGRGSWSTTTARAPMIRRPTCATSRCWRRPAAEPGNCRYMFYLAQSLRDAGQFARSRERYLQRAAMGGWERSAGARSSARAQMAELTGAPVEQVREGYLSSYQARPTRAEPLYELARYPPGAQCIRAGPPVRATGRGPA